MVGITTGLYSIGKKGWEKETLNLSVVMVTLDQIGTKADNIYEQTVNFSRIKARTFMYCHHFAVAENSCKA